MQQSPTPSEAGTIVYHGSPVPIVNFDPSRQVSGYYPGFHTTTEVEMAREHGPELTALRIDPKKFYTIDPKTSPADELKLIASRAGKGHSRGSGAPEAEYLREAGYDGIRRGVEFIVFAPERHPRVDPPSPTVTSLPAFVPAASPPLSDGMAIGY